MTDKASSDLWWKDAVIYRVDVKTHLDSTADGWGGPARLPHLPAPLDMPGSTTVVWHAPAGPDPTRSGG